MNSHFYFFIKIINILIGENMIKQKYVALIMIAIIITIINISDNDDENQNMSSLSSLESETIEISEGNSTYIYELDTDKNLTLLSYHGDEKKIILPPNIVDDDKTYPIRFIGDRAFMNSDASSILIMSDIISIGSESFLLCNNLESVKFLGKIDNIDNLAFGSCKNLNELCISGDDITIGIGAFKSCTGLKMIDISCNNITLDSDAFYGCISLEQFIVSGNVKELRSAAFEKCEKLESIKMNVNGLRIERSAFSECTSLKSIEFVGMIKSIGNTAFSDCVSLQSIGFINGLEFIGNASYSNCHSLKVVELPNTLKEIGDRAFYNCGSIISFKICGNNELSIGKDSLYSAFASLNNEIYVQIPIKLKIDLIKASFNDSIPIHIVIPNTVYDIEDNAFKDYKNIVEVIFHDKVTKIGNNAFSGLEHLKYLNLPKSLEYIGNNAFENNDDIYSIVIPSNVTQIGTFAFFDCDHISSIIISKNIRNIGKNAFAEIDDLYSVCFMGTIDHLEMPHCIVYNENSIFYNSGTKYSKVDKSMEICIRDSITNTQSLEAQFDSSIYSLRVICDNVVIFDPNGGIPQEMFKTVESGKSITPPENPIRRDDHGIRYIFNGWDNNGKIFDFNTIVEDDVYLTAIWYEEPLEQQVPKEIWYYGVILIILIGIIGGIAIIIHSKNSK